jgi:hypothetical protein
MTEDEIDRIEMHTNRHKEKHCIHDLTIGCVFQNEAPYLKEWIEYHKIIGVQHFVLVDDRSSDNFRDILRPYVDAGDVELFSRPCPEDMRGRNWPEYQRIVQEALVAHSRGVSRWLALIDTDEFIVPSQMNSVIKFLRDYEHCGGLYVRWEPFGTSYVAKLSDGELLTQRMYLKWRFRKGHDMLGKSIVKPHLVLRANIHRCELVPGVTYFDSNPGMQDIAAPIKIHHYWGRDETFLLTQKLPRTAKIKGWDIDHEKERYFIHLFNEVPDHTMCRFARELRTRVFHYI